MKNTGTFYIVVPVNFEEMAADELSKKLNFYYPDLVLPELILTKGGIELDLPHEIGFSLNHILKLPTRILLRVDSFKCRDFPKLYNKIKKIEWRKYLIGQIPKVDCSSRRSRLINTKRIKETTHSAIKKYYKGFPPKKLTEEQLEEPNTIIFLRIEDDHCTVSVDTSGQRLNIRGQRKLIGDAPIRENLAAGVLYSLKDKIADLDHIIDPMCGAGTLLIEARDFYLPNYRRKFSYQYFPLYIPTSEKQLGAMHATLAKNLYGFDIDKKMVEIAKENVGNRASIERRDATTVYPKEFENGAIVINPPYGQRIIPDNKLDRFYSQIIKSLGQSYSPKLIAMIIPTSLKLRKVLIPKDHQLIEIMKFKNGGLNVRLISVERLS